MKKQSKKPLSPNILGKIAKLSLSAAQKKKLERILSEPFAYIPDTRFSRPSVMKPIMAHNVTTSPAAPMRPDDEQILFLQMNYARHRMCQLRRKLLRKSFWQEREVRQLLQLYQKQLEYRSNIVTSNIGLVLAMIHRAAYPGVEHTDLISEGSMALLRAADKFDCSRGFKFSTYACRAILKGFSRAAKQSYRYHRLFCNPFNLSLQKDDTIEVNHAQHQKELVDEVQMIMRDNLADLSNIELSVVRLRFSLPDNQDSPLTLKQVGQRLGLTKERIRQIQNNALEKLRAIAEQRQVTV